MNYRADIDGLRAVAILMVLLFHAFPDVLPGGFIGVDVFFVISGFLISGIIFQALASGRFSFVDFYSRRIRRIFPALIVVLLSCLAIGEMALLEDEFQSLSKHVLAGAAFLSNILLWREVGYFDVATQSKPLLHLWSLGIEEQFYIIWPFLLVLAFKIRRFLPVLIISIALSSFFLCLLFVDSHATAVFYFPVTRFWELLIGSLFAYHRVFPRGGAVEGRPRDLQFGNKSRLAGDLQSILGLSLIVLSSIFTSSSDAFPGWLALPPTIGSILLISAGPQATVNSWILSNRGFVYVGLISYPLYLWHWPLLSLAQIIHGDPLTPAVRILLVLVSIVLASLTYHLIERPLRSRQRKIAARFPVYLAGSMAALGFVAVLGSSGVAVPYASRFPAMREVVAATRDHGFVNNKTFPGTADRAVLLFGDSHVQQYSPKIEALLGHRDRQSRTVIFRTNGGCAPIPNIERRSITCSSFVEDGFRIAEDPHVDTVVIGASWEGMVSRDDYLSIRDGHESPVDFLSPRSDWIFDAWAKRLKSLTERGKTVVIILSTPRDELFNPKRMVTRRFFDFEFHPVAARRADLTAEYAAIHARLKDVAKASGALVIDPLPYFCDSTWCPVVFDEKRPISTDGSHLRNSYVQSHVQYLDRFIYLDSPIVEKPSIDYN